jgi:hypothetical protein
LRITIKPSLPAIHFRQKIISSPGKKGTRDALTALLSVLSIPAFTSKFAQPVIFFRCGQAVITKREHV